MYYNARWYDPSLGRFAQADSIIPPGVQGLDRYAYVNNSPVNYVDPSGHICVESDGDSDVGMAGNCHGGSNPNFRPGLQGSTSAWTRNRGRSENTGVQENKSNGTATGTISPPGPSNPLACFRNFACMEEPNIELHPSDIILPTTVGKVIIYSPDEEVIGYKEIYVRPNLNSYTIHPDMVPPWIAKQITDNVSVGLLKINLTLLGHPEAAAAVDVVNKIQTAVDVINLANLIITFESNGLKTGPFIPVTNAPMPVISSPFNNFP